eukprot:TRINITY_DN15495_c0_g1_i1.p1 TRINITY_DN15495_c0_g1~~TRINITY_DN15495_c0_g1_i1.p1  ORF type:complete len:1198 (-),score=295.31 TRINITY_DN15495_c0_g1_i1:60-3617(-)
MSDFETSGAGKTLLRLVARANAIIAEILRLSTHIPQPFQMRTQEAVSKYGRIVVDFAYLDREKGKGPDFYEEAIDKDERLRALDNEFKDTYLKKLQRFYNLFEVIWKYGNDLAKYFDDVDNGNYTQQTLEGILLDKAGKQMISEAVYLHGVILLLLDQKIDGLVRERILVSCLRYMGHNELQSLDEIAIIIERTGYDAVKGGYQRIPGYPEKYFSRIPLPKNAIQMVLGRLRSDDVYNIIPCYPLPSQRSTALATQAQMLYVCLFFAPEILMRENATMREIVDKHFPDNWVITMYLGFTVDLMAEWEVYPAARLALGNTTEPAHIRDLVIANSHAVPDILKQLQYYLEEGTLTHQFVLRQRAKLFECLRAANATLRWLMLHTRKSNKKILEAFCKDVNQGQILLLLLKTAQFEFKLKNCIQEILDTRKEKWEEDRKESSERVKELKEVFAGEKALSRVKPNERLKGWFGKIGEQIDSLDFDKPTVSGRRIQQLIQALTEVTRYHQIEQNVPVKNFLVETGKYLQNMTLLLHISEENMYKIDIISDFSYARDIIYEYIPEMQRRISADPGSVILLRSTFLKLASILHSPTFRLGDVTMGGAGDSPAPQGEEQAGVGHENVGGKDLVMVSEYYSKELVQFVRGVLQIIPDMMFQILAEIILTQTNTFQEMPSRVEKMDVEKYAQLETRGRLVRLTYNISLFTEGILALDTTLVGVLKVDPKQLLEEGIRKILVKKICENLDTLLIFNTNSLQEFSQKLGRLTKVLEGFRRSFNYIQDYVNIYGLKIWQEEFQRIISYYVERECDRFMKQVHEGTKSQFQSKIIPIPEPMYVKGSTSDNFIGRLGAVMLHQTDVQRTCYIQKLSAWYSREEMEILGIKMFDLLIDSIGAIGVTGLDRYFGFSIVKELQAAVSFVNSIQQRDKGRYLMEVRQLFKDLSPISSTPPQASKLYLKALKIAEKLTPLSVAIAKIGQKQLLRQHLANIVRFKSSILSGQLFCSLETMNQAVLNDTRAHYRNPEKPSPKPENHLMQELSTYLVHVGLHSPLNKIYLAVNPVIDFPINMFLVTLNSLRFFSFSAHLGVKPSKAAKETLDEVPFVVGLVTFLRQFHQQNTTQYFALIGQYVLALVSEHVEKYGKKSVTYPPEVTKMLTFVDLYCKISDTPRKDIEQFIPSYIFNNFLEGNPLLSTR